MITVWMKSGLVHRVTSDDADDVALAVRVIDYDVDDHPDMDLVDGKPAMIYHETIDFEDEAEIKIGGRS